MFTCCATLVVCLLWNDLTHAVVLLDADGDWNEVCGVNIGEGARGVVSRGWLVGVLLTSLPMSFDRWWNVASVSKRY